eukprot:COSAG05_NODE_1343_length_5135_cov_4.082208_6_plen_161_part_00
MENTPKSVDATVSGGGEGCSRVTTNPLHDGMDINSSSAVADLPRFGAVGAEACAEFLETEAEKQARYQADWGGLLHPDGKARRIYDMGQLTVMLYLLWLLPRRFAFNDSMRNNDSTSFKVAADVLVDMSVVMDIFMQMRMYYFDKKTKELVTDKARIKRE